MNQSSGLLNIHYLLDLLDGNIIATGTIVVRCTYIYITVCISVTVPLIITVKREVNHLLRYLQFVSVSLIYCSSVKAANSLSLFLPLLELLYFSMINSKRNISVSRNKA